MKDYTELLEWLEKQRQSCVRRQWDMDEKKFSEAAAAIRELMDFDARKIVRMPVDSDEANKWLNENAPPSVLEALWKFRLLADNALEIAKAKQ